MQNCGSDWKLITCLIGSISMAPRITLSVTPEGVVEVWLNGEGRDLLVRKLQLLNDGNDHFHLGSFDDAEVQLGRRGYNPTDKIIDVAKVLFRTDEWDKRYYPHVLDGRT
jgi:hypothetical protein